jgi:putative addiction module component (TIGR02574 family)
MRWRRLSREEVFPMAQTLQSLGIDRMSVEERIALATAIWESIAAETHPPLLTESQRLELERRRADHAANPNDVIPWEQIKAGALARFQR